MLQMVKDDTGEGNRHYDAGDQAIMNGVYEHNSLGLVNKHYQPSCQSMVHLSYHGTHADTPSFFVGDECKYLNLDGNCYPIIMHHVFDICLVDGWLKGERERVRCLPPRSQPFPTCYLRPKLIHLLQLSCRHKN